MAGHRILRRLAKILIVASVIICLVIAVGLYIMARKDKENERFLNTGKSVNQFLSYYKHGMEESFKKKDASEGAQFCSYYYSSPMLGRWMYEPGRVGGQLS